ncbi:MAG: phage holin family protein [Bacteroidaceae bacterium]|nr:phage holin family protein [Bacteroidaceae bacterium]
MFTDDKNIDNIQKLFSEFKKYLLLQKEYTFLEITEKLTIFFSTLILVIILIILGMIALFYLFFAFAYILESWVGSLKISFCIIAALNLLLISLTVVFRKKLIILPMTRFLSGLFLNDSKKKQDYE